MKSVTVYITFCVAVVNSLPVNITSIFSEMQNACGYKDLPSVLNLHINSQSFLSDECSKKFPEADDKTKVMKKLTSYEPSTLACLAILKQSQMVCDYRPNDIPKEVEILVPQNREALTKILGSEESEEPVNDILCHALGSEFTFPFLSANSTEVWPYLNEIVAVYRDEERCKKVCYTIEDNEVNLLCSIIFAEARFLSQMYAISSSSKSGAQKGHSVNNQDPETGVSQDLQNPSLTSGAASILAENPQIKETPALQGATSLTDKNELGNSESKAETQNRISSTNTHPASEEPSPNSQSVTSIGEGTVNDAIGKPVNQTINSGGQATAPDKITETEGKDSAYNVNSLTNTSVPLVENKTKGSETSVGSKLSDETSFHNTTTTTTSNTSSTQGSVALTEGKQVSKVSDQVAVQEEETLIQKPQLTSQTQPSEDVNAGNSEVEEYDSDDGMDYSVRPHVSEQPEHHLNSSDAGGMLNQKMTSEQEGDVANPYVGVAMTDDGDAHFYSYFFTVVMICIIGYLVFHNKQKIIALVIEGRHGKGSRRRPSTSGYRKLDSNLEEAVTSSRGASVTHVIY